MIDTCVDDLVAAGRLVRVLDDGCPRFPGFMPCYPRQRHMSSALRAFIDLARHPAMALPARDRESAGR